MKDNDKGLQMLHNTEEKDEKSLINKEEEFEWGQHPNSIKALKKHQFPKGVSGNALGRKPKFESLKKQLNEIGDEIEDDLGNYCGERTDDDISKREKVLRRIWCDAITGDIKKIQLLAWLGCLD